MVCRCVALLQVVTVNGARVRRHDMLATNGVIHVIDRVLYPMADLSLLDHLTSCDTFTGMSALDNHCPARYMYKAKPFFFVVVFVSI